MLKFRNLLNKKRVADEKRDTERYSSKFVIILKNCFCVVAVVELRLIPCGFLSSVVKVSKNAPTGAIEIIMRANDDQQLRVVARERALLLFDESGIEAVVTPDAPVELTNGLVQRLHKNYVVAPATTSDGDAGAANNNSEAPPFESVCVSVFVLFVAHACSLSSDDDDEFFFKTKPERQPT